MSAPLTPAEDPEPTSPVIDYSPATVSYNEAFENDLMRKILHGSSSPPRNGPSEETHHISPTSLPLPLSSALRTHPSPIPGVYLTHPNGYHTGGPGPSPNTVADFAQVFIEEHGIQDAAHLEKAKAEKIEELMDTARKIAREREQAVKKNETINRQLEDLEVQRKAEVRVEEKIKEEKARQKG